MRVIEILHCDQNYYIVGEFAEGGVLHDRMMSEDKFTEKDAAFIIR